MEERQPARKSPALLRRNAGVHGRGRALEGPGLAERALPLFYSDNGTHQSITSRMAGALADAAVASTAGFGTLDARSFLPQARGASVPGWDKDKFTPTRCAHDRHDFGADPLSGARSPPRKRSIA